MKLKNCAAAGAGSSSSFPTQTRSPPSFQIRWIWRTARDRHPPDMRRHERLTRPRDNAWLKLFSEIAPAMQTIAVLLEPAIADIFTIVHVGDHDVPYPVVRLPLRLLHRRSQAADNEH